MATEYLNVTGGTEELVFKLYLILIQVKSHMGPSGYQLTVLL